MIEAINVVNGDRHDGLQVGYNSVRTIYSLLALPLLRMCELCYNCHMYILVLPCIPRVIMISFYSQINALPFSSQL